MQPYELLYPNLETEVYCVLGLQEESKMANRGMQTVCANLFCVVLPADGFYSDS